MCGLRKVNPRIGAKWRAKQKRTLTSRKKLRLEKNMTKHHLKRAPEIDDRFRCGLLDPSVAVVFLDWSGHRQSQHSYFSLSRMVSNVSVHAATHTYFLSHPWVRFMK